MNGIENILEKIQAEAAAEVAALESETEAKCLAIREQAEIDAREAYWAVMRQGAEKSAQRRERAQSMAAMEVKKQVLAVKQEMLELAFQRAIDRLCGLPEAQYEQLLASLAAGAASGTEKVLLSPADRARVGKKVVVAANRLLEERGKPGGLTLSENTRQIRGGLILEQGRVETNCSFEALVEQNRNRLTGEVAKLLFD